MTDLHLTIGRILPATNDSIPSQRSLVQEDGVFTMPLEVHDEFTTVRKRRLKLASFELPGKEVDKFWSEVGRYDQLESPKQERLKAIDAVLVLGFTESQS